MKKMLLSLLALVLLVVLFLVAMNRLAPVTAFGWIVKAGRLAAGLEEKRVVVNGQDVPYLVGGQGKPLLLIHGFTANKGTFTDISRFLTPHYTVYALDLPGFGDATRDPQADYSMDAQVEHVHAFISALGLKNVHVGGNSMGGGIAALLAGRYPQDVASLWLLDAAATHDAAQSDLVKTYKATGEFALLNKRPEDYDQRWQYLFAKPKFIPYAYSYTLGTKQAEDDTLHRQILNTLQTSKPIEERFAQLQVPTLIVTGAQDRVIPPSSVNTLARVFVNSQIKIMPDVGHVPMVEAPAQTAEDYLRFRNSLKQAE